VLFFGGGDFFKGDFFLKANFFLRGFFIIIDMLGTMGVCGVHPPPLSQVTMNDMTEMKLITNSHITPGTHESINALTAEHDGLYFHFALNEFSAGLNGGPELRITEDKVIVTTKSGRSAERPLTEEYLGKAIDWMDRKLGRRDETLYAICYNCCG